MDARNLVRVGAACCIAVWLAGCSPPPAEPPPDPTAADQVGEADPLPRTLPPPSDSAPRYVGLWAAAAEGCANPPWRFEANRVSTQGEVSCAFDATRITSTGYDIDATCVAQAPPERHSIQISFAESARAMMISGGPWAAPISLVYCGPLAPP